MNATISAETITNEMASVLHGFQKGLISEDREQELCDHLDRLQAQEASIYDRTYWLALAGTGNELTALQEANQAQYEADFFAGGLAA